MPNMCASLGSLIPGTTLLSLDLNKSANHPVIRQKLHVQTLRKHPGTGQKKRVSAVPKQKITRTLAPKAVGIHQVIEVIAFRI